ncbi:ABC transporter ATP-binding protein [bacterium]|nr:ABC transporter ATP-binding protein [bacterium]
MTELLVAEKLVKSYHDGERELKVLRGATLTVGAGEAVAVIGMSGSGKSTLLHLLGGLDVPDEGTITFDGKPLSGRSVAQLSEWRNRSIGYVFQFHHLLPEFSAIENVMMPALIAGRRRDEVEASAMEMLKGLGLGERLRHRPSRLSGGEQQRVALCRALVNQPRLLMADEPTGNLDLKTGETVIELMWKNTVAEGRGLIIVTHEPTIAMRAHRIMRLHGGTLHPVETAELEAQIAERRRR